MSGTDVAEDILFDLDVERQRNLLSDSGTALKVRLTDLATYAQMAAQHFALLTEAVRGAGRGADSPAVHGELLNS